MRWREKIRIKVHIYDITTTALQVQSSVCFNTNVFEFLKLKQTSDY